MRAALRIFHLNLGIKRIFEKGDNHCWKRCSQCIYSMAAWILLAPYCGLHCVPHFNREWTLTCTTPNCILSSLCQAWCSLCSISHSIGDVFVQEQMLCLKYVQYFNNMFWTGTDSWWFTLRDGSKIIRSVSAAYSLVFKFCFVFPVHFDYMVLSTLNTLLLSALNALSTCS